jgi:hypothetical protein
MGHLLLEHQTKLTSAPHYIRWAYPLLQLRVAASRQMLLDAMAYGSEAMAAEPPTCLHGDHRPYLLLVLLMRMGGALYGIYVRNFG